MIVIGQNTISNPGFETITSNVTGPDQVYKAVGWIKGCGTHYNVNASPPNYESLATPDLFDRYSTSSSFDFPAGQNPPYVYERTGKDRFVYMSGGYTKMVNGVSRIYYCETVKGTLSEALIANCSYSISFYACPSPGSTPVLLYNKVEVLLRKEGDCNNSKTIFTSTNISNTAWTQYSGTFTLTQAEVNIGYNRVEFRMTPTPLGYYGEPGISHSVYLDDVSLTKNYSTINPDFTIQAIHVPGNTTYTVTAYVSSVPAGSSFAWEVAEVDVYGNVIPNTVLSNPPSWWNQSLLYVNPFPGYCCLPNVTQGNGTFYFGHRYRITRGTWGPCANWTSISKVVYIGPPTKSGSNITTIELDTIYKPDFEKFMNHNQAIDRTLGPNNLTVVNKIDEISVAPNPCSGFIEVNNLDSEIIHDGKFSLYNLDGKDVTKSSQISYFQNNIRFDVSRLRDGVYFLRVVYDKQIRMIKIIKLN